MLLPLPADAKYLKIEHVLLKDTPETSFECRLNLPVVNRDSVQGDKKRQEKQDPDLVTTLSQRGDYDPTRLIFSSGLVKVEGLVLVLLFVFLPAK